MDGAGRTWSAVARCVVVAVLAGCGGESAPEDGPLTSAATPADGPAECAGPSPVESAQRPPHVDFDPADPTRITRAVLMNGREILPRGRWMPLGTMCTALAVRPPDGREVAVTCSGEKDGELEDVTQKTLRIVDLQTLEQRTIARPNLFYGLAYTPDGTRLVASAGGDSAVEVFDATDGYRLVRRLPVKGLVTYGVAVTPDGRSILAAESHAQSVVQIDVETGDPIRRFETLTFPFAIQVTPDGRKAYVSCVGNRGVVVLDLVTGRTLASIETGKNPEGMGLSDDGLLYVANTDSDSITRIDTASDTVVDTTSLRDADGLGGIDPTTVRLSADGARLYVPCSGDGAVRVLRRSDMAPLGAVQGLDFVQDAVEVGDGLLVLSGKGLNTLLQAPVDAFDRSAQLQAENQTVLNHRGALQVIRPLPTDADLAAWGQEVQAGLDAPSRQFTWPCAEYRGTVPRTRGTPSDRVKHVVYVVKENKTYDSLLGDLAGEQGDAWHEPGYALFGEAVPAKVVPKAYAGRRLDVTPNLHAIAREYCNLANFYNNADRSTQGHQWSTAGRLTDFLEKLWTEAQDGAQFTLPGADEVTQPEQGHIVDQLVAAGKSVRIYGEFASFVEHIADYQQGGWVSYALDYPPGMNAVPDFVKVQAFQKDLDAGLLRDFTYILMMNDHTYGFAEGRPHPAFMVADNDRATGLVVDALARSPYWEDTVVFILEDDPQDVPDHVDPHRSLMLVAGGPVKRGHTSTVLHDYPSLHATSLGLLGVPPLNRRDARAAPFHECFADEVAPERYVARPMDEALQHKWEWIVGSFETTPEAKPLLDRLVTASADLDLTDIDRAPGLAPVLWDGMMGTGRAVPGREVEP